MHESPCPHPPVGTTHHLGLGAGPADQERHSGALLGNYMLLLLETKESAKDGRAQVLCLEWKTVEEEIQGFLVSGDDQPCPLKALNYQLSKDKMGGYTQRREQIDIKAGTGDPCAGHRRVEYLPL